MCHTCAVFVCNLQPSLFILLNNGGIRMVAILYSSTITFINYIFLCTTDYPSKVAYLKFHAYNVNYFPLGYVYRDRKVKAYYEHPQLSWWRSQYSQLCVGWLSSESPVEPLSALSTASYNNTQCQPLHKYWKWDSNNKRRSDDRQENCYYHLTRSTVALSGVTVIFRLLNCVEMLPKNWSGRHSRQYSVARSKQSGKQVHAHLNWPTNTPPQLISRTWLHLGCLTTRLHH